MLIMSSKCLKPRNLFASNLNSRKEEPKFRAKSREREGAHEESSTRASEREREGRGEREREGEWGKRVLSSVARSISSTWMAKGPHGGLDRSMGWACPFAAQHVMHAAKSLSTFWLATRCPHVETVPVYGQRHLSPM